MKTALKSLAKILTVLMIIFFAGNSNSAKAQEKYSFATWSNVFDHSKSDIIWVIFTIPSSVSFISMDGQAQQKWQDNFKKTMIRNLGTSTVEGYGSPLPSISIHDNYGTITECFSEMEKIKNNFVKQYSGLNKRIKFMNLTVDR